LIHSKAARAALVEFFMPAAPETPAMPAEAATISIILIAVFSFFIAIVAYGARQSTLARQGK
jgi:hypothetical protein